MTAYWITGDTREVMAQLPAGSVDLVLTSPPFLALRSYLPPDHPDKHREIGSEPTPGAFIDTLLDLTAEWARLLTPHGSLCVELGDTYCADTNREAWPQAKSLCLIPELYRVALVYGLNPLTGRTVDRWRARNVVRWVRPNPPVGALGDKFRPATSEMVVVCKSDRRWFDLDAVRTEAKWTPNQTWSDPAGATQVPGQPLRKVDRSSLNPAGAPPLDWWQISPGGYGGAHYAVFPAELCIRPIEAMCPRRVCRTCGKPSRREVESERSNNGAPIGDAIPIAHPGRASDGGGEYLSGSGRGSFGTITTTTGWSSCGCPGTDGIRLDGYHTGTGWRPGIVLDPFGGSGTTALVATGHGRDCVSIDLDERNVDLARERLGMFLEVTTADELAGRLGNREAA